MRRIVTDAAVRRAVLAGQWNRMGTVEIFRSLGLGGKYTKARGIVVANALRLMSYEPVRRLIRNRTGVEHRVDLWIKTRDERGRP